LGGGRSDVRACLGEGAAKLGYLARDTKLDRDVAVALIKTESLDAEGVLRVRREAQSMARLDHPAIVTVHDIGEEAGQPYIVAEGADLDFVLPRFHHHGGGCDVVPVQSLRGRELKRDPPLLTRLQENALEAPQILAGAAG